MGEQYVHDYIPNGRYLAGGRGRYGRELVRRIAQQKIAGDGRRFRQSEFVLVSGHAAEGRANENSRACREIIERV